MGPPTGRGLTYLPNASPPNAASDMPSRQRRKLLAIAPWVRGANQSFDETIGKESAGCSVCDDGGYRMPRYEQDEHQR